MLDQRKHRRRHFRTPGKDSDLPDSLIRTTGRVTRGPLTCVLRCGSDSVRSHSPPRCPLQVNRRSFLKSTSFAAAGACAAAHPPALGQSASSAQLYANCKAAHALAGGQSLYNRSDSAVGSCWAACWSPLVSIATDWQQNDFDQQVMAAASRFQPSWLRSDSLDKGSIVKDLQVFTPQVTATDVQRSLAFIDEASPNEIQNTIVSVQQTGLRPSILALANQAANLAVVLSANAEVTRPLFTQPDPPSGPPDPVGGGSTGHPGPQPVQGGDGGGGGNTPLWSCGTDGFAIVSAGLAIAMVTIMTLPITGPFLVAAEWTSILGWTTVGTGAWGAIHAHQCGF